MSIIRLFQPSITENEKTFDYNVDNLSRDTVSQILNGEFLDGVFGVEYFRINKHPTLTLFAPPHHKFKNNLRRSNSAHYINSTQENTTYIQLYQEKSSMFPIEFNYPKSFIEMINTLIPSHIYFKYQLLLVYRQDNWKERIIDQYEDYLNGVQSPSDSGLFRKFQRGITEKVDSLLKWEQKHSEIKEVNSKVAENGFRFTLRIALIGGDKKERDLITNNITFAINEFSYTNNWFAYTKFNFDEISDLFNRRKLDNSSKSSVLTTSELTPFLLTSINSPTLSVETIQESNPTIPIEDDEINQIHENAIDILPTGNDIEEVDSTEISNKFIHALKEVKKYRGKIELVNSQSGSTTMKLTYALPNQIKYSEITKANVIDDIKIKMGVKSMQIKQGQNVGEFDVVIPLEKRQKVFLGNYLNSDKFIEFANNHPLPFLVGVDEVGNPIMNCMSKIKHLLVAGSTGSGKSVWMNQTLLAMLLTKSRTDLLLYLIDVKQTELVFFEGYPQVESVITDADKAIALLDKLVEEMNSRYSLFKEEGVKTIKQYNKKSNNTLPHILCVIDEYAELTSRNKDVHERIQSLTQLSRASGVHLIIATQRPSVDVISGTIKSNLPSKIGFRCADRVSYRTFLNTTPKFDLLGGGDGVMEFEGEPEQKRFQGCLIIDDPNDDNLEVELICKIAEQVKNNESLIDIPQQEDEDLVRVREIILNTGVCKVSELRGLVKMNINKLNDIMKQLVVDGVLLSPISRQSGYSINPDYKGK